MKNEKLQKLLMIALPLAAAVLTALPQYVKMRFAAPAPEPPYITYCSGFSLLPMGYGNWGPILAGIFSCVLVILTVVHCFFSCKKLENWILGLAVAGAGILTATSLLFGSGTVLSWLVVAALAAQALFTYKLKE